MHRQLTDGPDMNLFPVEPDFLWSACCTAAAELSGTLDECHDYAELCAAVRQYKAIHFDGDMPREETEDAFRQTVAEVLNAVGEWGTNLEANSAAYANN